jgi:hypothetical protein
MRCSPCKSERDGRDAEVLGFTGTSHPPPLARAAQKILRPKTDGMKSSQEQEGDAEEQPQSAGKEDAVDAVEGGCGCRCRS